ncbi:hypothetical protein C8R46DRAFT_1043435 [Mycena filopes]|nr:hypothetical protein C8R46DRAFT_1043435 [Mycena filopes]
MNEDAGSLKFDGLQIANELADGYGLEDGDFVPRLPSVKLSSQDSRVGWRARSLGWTFWLILAVFEFLRGATRIGTVVALPGADLDWGTWGQRGSLIKDRERGRGLEAADPGGQTCRGGKMGEGGDGRSRQERNFRKVPLFREVPCLMVSTPGDPVAMILLCQSYARIRASTRRCKEFTRSIRENYQPRPLAFALRSGRVRMGPDSRDSTHLLQTSKRSGHRAMTRVPSACRDGRVSTAVFWARESSHGTVGTAPVGRSDVLAWLGFETLALAWLRPALASYSSSQSQSHQSWLGLAWLWLKPGLSARFIPTVQNILKHTGKGWMMPTSLCSLNEAVGEVNSSRSPLTGAKPRLKPRLLASPSRSQSQSHLQAKILAWLGLIKPGLWLLGFWLEAKPRASLGTRRRHPSNRGDGNGRQP